jgi:hypothetical protein
MGQMRTSPAPAIPLIRRLRLVALTLLVAGLLAGATAVAPGATGGTAESHVAGSGSSPGGQVGGFSTSPRVPANRDEQANRIAAACGGKHFPDGTVGA